MKPFMCIFILFIVNLNRIPNSIASEVRLELLKRPPIQQRWHLYFFQIDYPTKFDGVNINSIKLKQVGPYVYNVHRQRVYIQVDPEEQEISYSEKNTFEFSPTLTGSKLHKNDSITLFNTGLALSNDFLAIFAQSFTTLTVSEAVDNIANQGMYSLLGKSLLRCLPESDEECNPIYVVGSGDTVNYGKLFHYGNSDFRTQFWSHTAHNETGHCNDLRGTDGLQFHSNANASDTLWVFEPMQCRSVKYTKSLTNQVYDNISTVRFYADESNFAASEENRCFCYEQDPSDCPAGILNLRNCPPMNKPPLEVMASEPYFLSNPSLLNATGLSPLIDLKQLTHENYGSFLDVEPITGLVVKSVRRIQFSALLKNGSHPLLMKLAQPKMLAPLLWLEEVTRYDLDYVHQLKDNGFH